eukprot:3196767-Rhodomonas_salina.2
MTLLRADLGLDDWMEIKSISDLREMLPRLSESLKKYSASSSARFSSDDVSRGCGHQTLQTS